MSTTEVIFAAVGACLTLAGVVAASAQVWVAISANKQATLAQQAADAQRASDDKRFALSICEPLATPEVHAILSKQTPSVEDRSFAEALYALCAVKVEALLSDEVKGDPRIARPIRASLDPVKAFLDHQGVEVDSSRLDEKLGRTDHSKYTWRGSGAHSKIWTINLIAERWAADKELLTRADFERSFGAELCAAVPDRADEYTASWLVTSEDQKYLKARPLTLDGDCFGIHWRCGFRNARIGTEVHRPIIEHFAERHSYPVVGS